MRIRNFFPFLALTFFWQGALSQCLDIDFNLQASSCLQETVEVSNISVDGVDFYWDFCPEDLNNDPIVTELESVSGASTVIDSKLIFDGTDWYIIMVSRANSKLFRAYFGSELDNTPVIDEIILTDNSGGAFATLWGIDVIQNDDGNWVALVTNANGAKLNLVEFGSSLANDAVVSEITKPSAASIITPYDVEFIKEGTDYYAFIANAGTQRLTKIEFGTSISTSPVSGESFVMASLARFQGFAMMKYCDNYYGFGISDNNDDVTRLDFGASVDNIPTENVLTLTPISGAVLNQAVGLEAYYHNGEFHLFAGSLSLKMFNINLGSDITAGTGDLYDINGYTTNAIQYSVDMVPDLSGFVGFGVNTSAMLKKVTFLDDCGASMDYSSSSTTETVSFSISGSKNVQLRAIDATGKEEILTKNVTISTDIAPDISFSYSTICASNPIEFQSINSSGDIVSNLWDFGDAGTSTDPNPSHLYSASGEYEVKVDVVSSLGCNNSVTQTITIYDEPVPNFTLPSGTMCTNEEYTFTNNTVDNFDGYLSYDWQVDGQSVGSDRDLIYQFPTGGAKEVKLITSIPGCDIESVQNIGNVEVGAVSLFSASDVCLNTPVQFANQSTGNIVNYNWDFGDANNSIDENPNHQYGSAGTYDVVLSVTNSAGCVTTFQQQVTIHAIPMTDFTNELECTNAPIQFTDLTTVDNANIVDWLWDFDDGSGGSTDSDPTHIFNTVGDYNVTLTTTSTYGCTNSSNTLISVIESPIAAMEINESCIGDPTSFVDLSTPSAGGVIESRIWVVDGASYTTSNFEHVFNSPGEYEVMLNITSNNKCSDLATTTIQVDTAPSASFVINSACVNTPTAFVENTDSPNDDIILWYWNFGGQGNSDSPTPNYSFSQPGSYEVTLDIVTEKGCISTTEQLISVKNNPVADFSTSQLFGPPPLTVQFTNLSTGAEEYLWEYGDAIGWSSNFEGSFTFDKTGNYKVKLISISTDGCESTKEETIYVVDPEIDLAIDNIADLENGQYLLTISNQSNIPVEEFTISVQLGTKLSIQEKVSLTLAPGESGNHLLPVTIPNDEVDYVCFTVSHEDQYEETNISNNEECISSDSSSVIMNAYPNPVIDFLTIPIIANSSSSAEVYLTDVAGNVLLFNSYSLNNDGLNELSLDLSLVRKGIYILMLSVDNINRTQRIFVE